MSLAGGLATMAEAVAGRADLLVLGVPTFGWAEGRRLLVERGSGAEVADFPARHPEYPEDDLQAVLAYFDAALFAPAIRCPTLLGIGRVDRVVPSACVRAIAARLRAPHEIMTVPVSHDSGPATRASVSSGIVRTKQALSVRTVAVARPGGRNPDHPKIRPGWSVVSTTRSPTPANSTNVAIVPLTSTTSSNVTARWRSRISPWATSCGVSCPCTCASRSSGSVTAPGMSAVSDSTADGSWSIR
ncbi:MAG: hypothetical protein KY460_01680 [Actinobacteria bacterium]|nr:hypothetical protein [Actinomycetota bacterium]